jgi:hypothetical protein
MSIPILYYKYGDRHCLEIKDNVKLSKYKHILQDSIKKNDIYVKLEMNDAHLEEKMIDYGRLGFYYPHVVVEKDPFILLRLTKGNFQKDYSEILPKFCNFILQNYKDYTKYEFGCLMHVRISKSCIKQLYKLVFINSDNNKPQTEFAGNLQLQSIAAKSKIIWKIGSEHDLKDIETGKTDNVEGPNEPFTFHTHPCKTYKDFKVKYAWPSKTDYESIWSLIVDMNGLCHFVAGVEGIYCVSINEKWSDKISELKEKNKHNILKHYEEKYVECNSNTKYTVYSYIQSIKEKVKKYDLPFDVQFMKWDEIPVFKIYVPKIKVDNEFSCKCFTTDL